MSEIFSPANLAKAVHESIEKAEAAIPPGHTQAILLDATYRDGQAGVRALYVRKVEDGWTIAGKAEYRKSDGPSAGVAVKWSGK